MSGRQTRPAAASLLWLSISLAAFAAFLPAARGAFLNWDDNEYVSENPHIQSLGADTVVWAFTAFHSSNWHPLTWLSHAVDYRLWGADPRGHHVVNVVLHAVNTWLVGLFVFLLASAGFREPPAAAPASSRRKPGSAPPPGDAHARAAITVSCAAALLFGLHPLRVESVAWIAERKDLLAALFALLSSVCYVRRADAQGQWARSGSYYASLLFYLLALLSKPMYVTLPLAFLVIDVFPLRRHATPGSRAGWRSPVFEKLPYFVLSAASSIVTVLAQRSGGTVGTLEAFPIHQRAVVAVEALGYYLFRTVVPVRLSPLYPYPAGPDFVFPSPGFVASAITLGVAGWYCLKEWRKGNPVFLSTLACCLIGLFPVLGLVHFGPQASADRYTYLTTLPLLVLVGLGFERLMRRLNRGAVVAACGALVVLGATLGILTVGQIRIWRDSLTLWNRVLELYPDSTVALNRRGDAYLRLENEDLALADFSRSIELSGGFFEPSLLSRARILLHRGRIREGLEDINRVLAAGPVRADALSLRAGLLGAAGDLRGALRDLDKAIEISPGEAEYYNNRGLTRMQAGELDRSLEDLNRAVSLSPGSADTLNNRGMVRSSMGDFEGAVRDCSAAVDLKPDFGAAYVIRCEARRRLGRLEEALADCSRGIELGERSATARNLRGLVLAELGRVGEALAAFDQALDIAPGNAEAHFNRASVLRASGNAAAALTEYAKAIELDGRFLEARNQRGTLLGQMGRSEEAIREFSAVISADPKHSQAYFNRGVARYSAGQRPAAIEDFKAAARLGDPEVQARLKKLGIQW